MTTFKIAFANIKKRKGSSISFLVMVFLAALMLSTSLSLMIGSESFFENKVNELNAPHYSTYILESKYKDPEFREFARDFAGTTNFAELDTLGAIGEWKMKSGTSSSSVFFYNNTTAGQNSFYKSPIIDKLQIEPNNMIVLPISFKFNGFKSGEKIIFHYNNRDITFNIYGFYEDPVMGSSVASVTITYINSNVFNTWWGSETDLFKYKTLIVRFEKSEMCNTFGTAFRKEAKLNNNEYFEMSYTDSEMAAMTFMDIASMFLIVFSVIMLVIAFIVVTFSISSSIVEDISNIGAFKSMGYSNSVLRRSQLLQYLLIAAIGAVLGTFISLVTFGFLGNIIASTSGLLWLNSINVMPALISIFLICVLTGLITYYATRKYKKITPIAALRQGGHQKASSVNKMPLEKGRLPLNVHLGFKRFFNSLKNNTSLGITVMLLVFVSLLVFIMSYNMNIDRTAMINMVGIEMSDIYIQAQPGTDIEAINNEIKTHTEVSRTMLTGVKNCFIGSHETFVSTVEDYSLLTINTVVRGRNPAQVANGEINEITLGSVTASAIKKDIGDIINLEIDGIVKMYRIVGITQNIGNGGGGCDITETAMNEHVTNFTMDTIYVYLKKGVDSKDYINALVAANGNTILVMDVNEMMDTILNSMGDPLYSVSLIMIILTLIIIAFVLFLITSALIRKSKKEFGIMKAIGYRNRALVLQLFLSLLPALVLGIVLGTVLGFFISNPLLSVFFASAGLLKTYFIIPVLVSILISLGILVTSVTVTYLIAYRLRKISPQKLIVEQ